METFDEIKTKFITVINEYCAQPTVNMAVDLSPGSALNELVVKLSAALQQEIGTNNDDLLTVNSVQEALLSSTDTYSAAIDKIASNYNVVRDAGESASGIIRVVVSSFQNYILAPGFKFTQPNLQVSFATELGYRVIASADTPIQSANEIRLFKYNDTSYYFLLPVVQVSTDTVLATSVPADTTFALDTGSKLTNFVAAYAYGSFTAGRNKETDRSLINRFKTGLSCKGLFSENSIRAILPELSTSLTTNSSNQAIVSVVGPNDEECTRTKHNAFGFTNLGMADVYLRSGATVSTGLFEIIATRVGSTDVWEAVIDNVTNTTVPGGFYNVLEVQPVASITAAGSYAVVAGYPIYDLATTRANSLTTVTEGRFTAFQKCTVRFTATGYDAGITSQYFQVKVSYMPLIKEAQDYFNSSINRTVCADYLIKAVTPCNVSMKLTLTKATANSVISTADVRKAIVDYINSLDFNQPIVVSQIVKICHTFDISKVSMPIKLTGVLWLPSTVGTSLATITSNNSLDLATLDFSQYNTSVNTTAFFADYTDTIAITVV